MLRLSARLHTLRAELETLAERRNAEARDVRQLAVFMPGWFRAVFDGSLSSRLAKERDEARVASSRWSMAGDAVEAVRREVEGLEARAGDLLQAALSGTDDPRLRRWVALRGARREVDVALATARTLQERADRATDRLTRVTSDRGRRLAIDGVLALYGDFGPTRDAVADASAALAAIGRPLPPLETPLPEGTPSGRVLDVGMEVFRAATGIVQRLEHAREAVDAELAALSATVEPLLVARAGPGAAEPPDAFAAAEACLRVAEAADALAAGDPSWEDLEALEGEAAAARTLAVVQGRDPGASAMLLPGAPELGQHLRALARGHRAVADALLLLARG